MEAAALHCHSGECLLVARQYWSPAFAMDTCGTVLRAAPGSGAAGCAARLVACRTDAMPVILCHEQPHAVGLLVTV